MSETTQDEGYKCVHMYGRYKHSHTPTLHKTIGPFASAMSAEMWLKDVEKATKCDMFTWLGDSSGDTDYHYVIAPLDVPLR